jgi:hypothetical protein
MKVEGTEALSRSNRSIPQSPRKKNARGERTIEERKMQKVSLRSRSNRAVVGLLVGGIAGYWLSNGNLLWTLVIGIIGAILASRFLD